LGRGEGDIGEIVFGADEREDREDDGDDGNQLEAYVGVVGRCTDVVVESASLDLRSAEAERRKMPSLQIGV